MGTSGENDIARPRKQEQEPARSEVSEVAPGVLRMELPIRIPGLAHVNCYALVDDRGASLVDPGLPGPRTWRAIKDRLRQAGLQPKHVHTVIVTHSHPDHFGGAGVFAKHANAQVVGHRRFTLPGADPAGEEPEVSLDEIPDPSAGDPERKSADDTVHPAPPAPGETPWGRERPRPPLRIRLGWRLAQLVMRSPWAPTITRPVDEGEWIRLAGRDWRIVHTPGHTGDHICLHDPEEGTFLSGDHVLPTITPHISGMSTVRDPLKAFFESLDRVAAIEGVRQVLPAHGHPFTDLKARAEAIKLHHDQRLDRLKGIGHELGLASVEAFSKHLFRPRNWGWMAESETYAHLEHLRCLGEAEARRGKHGQVLFETG